MANVLPEVQADKMIEDKISEWETGKEQLKTAQKEAAIRVHPFYKTYVRASENEKEEINTQIHNSVDYRPAQYWFNAVFLWFICFTTIWFFGLMTQGVINLVRQKPDLK